jgi:hypothetical protein
MVLKDGQWVDGTPLPWFSNYGEILGLAAFILLVGFVYFDAKKAK